MRIGEIAEKAHISKSIIRYYEGKCILPRPPRNRSGYREYCAEDLARIQLVAGARRLGCSFAEIKAIVELREMQCSPSSNTRELIDYKVLEASQEIDRLRHIQSELLRLQELDLQLPDG